MLQDVDAASFIEFTPPECPNCGGTRTSLTKIKSAIWHQDRLVVVEDIPAAVCEDCGERYFDDATVTVLDLMQGDGFPAEKAQSEMRVPVFTFSSPGFSVVIAEEAG